MTSTLNPWLVALSLLIAICASYTALDVAQHMLRAVFCASAFPVDESQRRIVPSPEVELRA